MADSASDPKVEDVLSSVRRLISQEIPKRTAAKPAGDAGALVLGSKDRIEAEHSRRVAAKSLEQRIAELEKAVDRTATEFEPDGSEDQAQHRPDRIVYTRPRPSEAEAKGRPSTLRLSEIALIETGEAPQETDTSADTPVPFRHAETSSKDEAPMAEDVPTLAAPKAEVTAFSDPDDVVARIEARIERGGDVLEPTVAEPAPAAEAKPATDADFDAELSAAVRASIVREAQERPEVSDTSDTLRPEEARGAAPETKSAVSSPAPETDVSQASEIAKPTEQAEAPLVLDVAQAAVLTARAKSLRENPAKPARPARSEQTAEQKAEAALATLADEDAMRLLVGRLLREELRGELGERITQNVRKLVRSEIKRVLETRTLD